MKHTYKVTLILVGFFLISQVIGLAIVNEYINHQVLEEEGEIEFVSLPYDVERPPVEEGSSVWYIVSAIFIGTLILLLIIKFKKIGIWKTWYFLSVFITLTVALGAFITEMYAAIIALLVSFFKIFKPNIWVHNISEIFIYGGLAAIFVPIMNVFSAVMLLILISIYDMYAVWKSKHMVALAKFTTESKVFAGLSVPYDKASGKIKRKVKGKVKLDGKGTVRHAILGGGDVGFPLLFAGVVMKGLMLNNDVVVGFLKALIIPIFTAIALHILFMLGDKNKFYPAMPFLSIGCFLGYGLVLLIELGA